jgi:two-component system cell cycle sensor histidine kinase/response regulator CckA
MAGPSNEYAADFRELVDNVRAVFWIVAPDGISVLYCSPAYEEFWGRSREELYADPDGWLEGIHPEDRDRVATTWDQGLTRYDTEYRVVRPDGEVTHVHDRAHPVLGADGTLERIVGITTDVTAIKRLEEQLQHAQKMESLGRLAGGVAHEVNNVLTIVLGQAQLAREHPDQAARHLDLIEDAVRRGGELTARLLGLTRTQPIRAGVLDVAATARAQERELRSLLGPGVELSLELQPELWPVRADADEIARLLLALAQNSADAMSAGGSLRVAVENVVLEAGDPAGRAPGEHVVMTVSDTGRGIGAEDLSRVFEPFFTTTPGAGGLGLPLCYGIVTRAGGSIRIDSAPGRGTTVICSFPRVASSARTARAARRDRGGDAGTVLVAEDEPTVREIVGRVLRTQGHEVIEAGDGAEALAAAGPDVRIGLLVTDVVMPRMGGRELAERLRAQRPGLRVLFVSGYSDDALGDAGDPATGFLAKPFLAAELAAAVRALLDAEPAANG